MASRRCHLQINSPSAVGGWGLGMKARTTDSSNYTSNKTFVSRRLSAQRASHWKALQALIFFLFVLLLLTFSFFCLVVFLILFSRVASFFSLLFSSRYVVLSFVFFLLLLRLPIREYENDDEGKPTTIPRTRKKKEKKNRQKERSQQELGEKSLSFARY